MPMHIINHAQLDIFTEGDQQEERALVVLFLEQAQLRLVELKTALNSDDAGSAWRLVVHQLKGSAANLGAEELAELCRRAEADNTAPVEKKLFHLNEIKAALERIQQFGSHSEDDDAV